MPLFLADLHLKSRTWTNNAVIRGDAYSVLQVIAQSTNSPTLIIGGDFFDSNRPTSEDLYHAATFLKNFDRVYYVRGNHDSCEPHWFESLRCMVNGSVNPQITELHGQIIEIEPSVYLTGISWMPSRDQLKQTIYDTIQYYCDNYPEDSRLYCVIHTSFKHLLAFEGAYTLDADAMNEKFGHRNITILVGDIHTRSTRTYYKKSDQSEGLIIHSPGACYPQSTAEIEEDHCVTQLNFGGGDAAFVASDVTVRQYLRVVWKDQEALDQILKSLNDDKELKERSVLQPLVWVVVTDMDRMPHINPADYPNLLIQIRVEIPDNADAAKVAGADPADGYTMQQALEDEFNDPDMAAMAIQLINSPSPLEELQRYTDFWKVEKVID